MGAWLWHTVEPPIAGLGVVCRVLLSRAVAGGGGGGHDAGAILAMFGGREFVLVLLLELFSNILQLGSV